MTKSIKIEQALADNFTTSVAKNNIVSFTKTEYSLAKTVAQQLQKTYLSQNW